jgi:hypothetical protein
VLELIVLGHIPGTNVYLTFNDIVSMAAAIIVVGFIISRLLKIIRSLSRLKNSAEVPGNQLRLEL